MTPVVICGMFGAGGTTLSEALRAAGLKTGDDKRLAALDDEALLALKGAWDAPPSAPSDSDNGLSKSLLARAKQLFADHPDGSILEDPLATLILPWWRQAAGDLRVAVAVKHPATVADSLAPAGMTPRRALQLWREYYERILGSTTASDRFVVHLDRFDPTQAASTQAISDLLAFSGLDPVTEESVVAASESITSTGVPPPAAQVDELVADLYGDLLGEAGHRRARRTRTTTAYGVRPTGGGNGRRQSTTGPAGTNGSFRPMRDQAPALPPYLAVPASPYEPRLAAIEDRLAEAVASDAALRVEVAALGDRLIRLVEDVQTTLESRRPALDDAGDRRPSLLPHLRDVVRDLVTIDATVAVISKGDDELLRLYGRPAWHFPRQLDGKWLGYHPKGSLAAIAHLETSRALGAQYLVVPATSAWWLTEYEAFASHLDSRYATLYEDPGVGRIYRLVRSENAGPEWGGVAGLLGRLQAEDGSAVVLDLTADAVVKSRFPFADTFTPVARGPVLPYADSSIPVVALDSTDEALLTEARRVATAAVVDPQRESVEILDNRERPLPSVSIIMPVHDNAVLTRAALRSLFETLPRGFSGEVLVVDDGSSDETRHLLEEWRAREPSIKLLRNDVAQGYLQANLRAIADATGEYLLFVNNDMVFLDGWLEALLRTFDRFPRAGAVGGRLLYPDGRLQEAGGLLFADGSAAKYGYGDPDPEAAEYAFVRPTDYCSGCLLITPRSVFDEVGGFDRSFDPGYYEDTDYCLRLRLTGWHVYYQPESIVVHVEGGTAGLDEAVGMKRHQAINKIAFMQKWREELAANQPERPEPCDNIALHTLVLAQRATAPAAGATR